MPRKALTLLRRASIRSRWEQLRRSDALEDLLDELALWTAMWNGLPLSRDDHLGLDRPAEARAALLGRQPTGSRAAMHEQRCRPGLAHERAAGAAYALLPPAWGDADDDQRRRLDRGDQRLVARLRQERCGVDTDDPLDGDRGVRENRLASRRPRPWRPLRDRAAGAGRSPPRQARRRAPAQPSRAHCRRTARTHRHSARGRPRRPRHDTDVRRRESSRIDAAQRVREPGPRRWRGRLESTRTSSAS